jgi:hypothetical protein
MKRNSGAIIAKVLCALVWAITRLLYEAHVKLKRGMNRPMLEPESRSPARVPMRRFVCPHCREKCKTPAGATGRRARCPRCDNLLDLPQMPDSVPTISIPPMPLYAPQLAESSFPTVPTVLPATENHLERVRDDKGDKELFPVRSLRRLGRVDDEVYWGGRPPGSLPFRTNENVYTATPQRVEQAQQEVARCEERWRQRGFARIDGETYSQKRGSVQTLAWEAENRVEELEALENERRQEGEKVARLQKALRVWESRQSLIPPFVAFFNGLAVSVVLGLCVAVASKTAVGLLVCFIGICLSVLFAVTWHYFFRSRGADEACERIIETLGNSEKRISELVGCVAAAESRWQHDFLRWEKEFALFHQMRELDDLYNSYQEALSIHQNLLNLTRSLTYQLLHDNWRAMRGTEFEDFLRRVFESLGYKVQMTKGSGDQGLDLILTGKGRRIGVQAKGYSDTVGNSAIQEANAGMGFYDCECCIAITNSTFSRSAKELADKIGCLLIDGTRLPDLIAGKITL